jgi:hypothetical protein
MKEVIFSLNLDISPSSMLDKNEFYEQTDTLGGKIIQNTNFNILNCNRRYKKTHGKNIQSRIQQQKHKREIAIQPR